VLHLISSYTEDNILNLYIICVNNDFFSTISDIAISDTSQQIRRQSSYTIIMAFGEKKTIDQCVGDSSIVDVEDKAIEEKIIEGPWWHVDMEFLPVKLAYFMNNLRTCCYTSFIILIFTSFGLNKAEAGLIAGFRLTGTIAGSFVWGVLADKSKHLKRIVFLQAACATLFMCSQPFISAKFGDKTINRCPNMLFIRTVINTTTPVNNSSSNMLQQPLEDTTSHDNTSLFWILMFVNIAATFFDGSLGNILDAVVMRKIDQNKQKVDFGRQRMFGTPSFVAGTILAKHLVAIKPEMLVSCYSSLFFLYMVFISLETMLLLFLVTKTKLKQKTVVATKYSKALIKTCFKPRTFLFFGTMIVNGFLLSAYMSYFVPYLTEKGAQDIVFDISFIINSTVGLAGIGLSTHIINFFRGTWNTFSVSILAFSLRFLVYGLASNPSYIMAVEPLHMFCYAVYISAYIRHVKEIANDTVINTMYCISNSLWLGIGFIAGNVIGGYLYETYGGRYFYLVQSTVAFAWFLVLCIRNIISAFSPSSDGDNAENENA